MSGTLLGILIYTVYYIGFVGASNSESCESGGVRLPDHSRRNAFFYHALTAGVLVFLFILTTFLGVREQKGDKTPPPPPSTHTHAHILWRPFNF